MFDPEPLIASFATALRQLAAAVNVTAQPTGAVGAQVASTITEKPGDAQSSALDGSLPPITQIRIVSQSGDGSIVRVVSDAVMEGRNIVFIPPDNGSPDQATRVSVLHVGEGFATTDAVALTRPGTWQARITDPVTYATSPWFAFQVP